MEELKVMNTEVEELEPANEAEEVSEGSSVGSLFAGFIGGFLAYAAICGAKKLKVIIEEKRAAKEAMKAVRTEEAVREDNGDDTADS